MAYLIRDIAILLGCCYLASCHSARPALDEHLSNENCPSNELICVRVENASELDFDKFEVRFLGQIEEFGPLEAGQTSSYRKIEKTYRYAYTLVISGSRRFVLQPIDFVGEKLVAPGSYTYRCITSVLEEPLIDGGQVQHGYIEARLVPDYE